MALLLRISAHHHLILSHSKFDLTTNPRVSACLRLRKLKNRPPDGSLHPPFCSASGDNSVSSLSDVESSSVDKEDVHENKNHAQEPLTSKETLEKLKRCGISGVLSYGLLNTAYYLTTFLLVWFYFAPAPGKMGYLAAVERFLKVMAMVWAGSQVTKLVRAGGALALAPFVDRGLSWFAVKYKFESREKAFFTIVGFCFGLAVVLFLAVTVVSA